MPIVETPGTLSGKPRIDGTRICVLHVLSALECGHAPEEIASETYPHLTVEQVTEAVEWLYDHSDRVYELRLDDLVAMEQGIRRSDKPPMAIWRAGTTFISEERYEPGKPDANEIIRGLFLEPKPRFARVYRDALHESYTFYDIDLDAGVASPVLDDPHVTLNDAIDRATEYAQEEVGRIADQVHTRRSVCLDKLPERTE